MNNEFRKEPDAGKPHVRNSVRDTSGNGRIYSTKVMLYIYYTVSNGYACVFSWNAV